MIRVQFVPPRRFEVADLKVDDQGIATITPAPVTRGTSLVGHLVLQDDDGETIYGLGVVEVRFSPATRSLSFRTTGQPAGEEPPKS